jgi:RNA polymerase-binding transcription factor DksA
MLTTEQIETFRKRLEEEQHALRERMGDTEQQLAEPEQREEGGHDATDEASLLYGREMQVAELRQIQARLTLIERALARIEDGTYGISEISGKPIPIERLEVLPTATTRADEPAPTL